LADRIAS
jgi:hypothetical protein